MTEKITNLTGNYQKINWRAANGSILTQELQPYELEKEFVFQSKEEFERFIKQNESIAGKYFIVGNAKEKDAARNAESMDKSAEQASAENLDKINEGIGEQAKNNGASVKITQNGGRK